MISYCPLDEIDTTTTRPVQVQVPQRPLQAPPQRKIQVPVPKESGFLNGEDTECNYLVLFFILGVLILACSDSVSIRR
jgi:hypothetical protein